MRTVYDRKSCRLKTFEYFHHTPAADQTRFTSLAETLPRVVPNADRRMKLGIRQGQVPGRHGMTYEEEDWVDQDATAHRGPDE